MKYERESAEEFRKRLDKMYHEGTALGNYPLIENLRKGKSIEIPSLNLRLNPDGSVTHLDES